MKIHPPLSLKILAILLVTSFPMMQAASAGSALTFKNNPKLHPAINPAFQATMQCVVNKLEDSGVKVVGNTGCYAGRPNFSASLHPRGLACDVMQTDRDKTRLRNYPLSNGTRLSKEQINKLADSCNVVSGGIWPGPPRPPNHGSDLGHFQMRSASRATQARQVSHPRKKNHQYRTKKRRRA